MYHPSQFWFNCKILKWSIFISKVEILIDDKMQELTRIILLA